jgi:hypothetical protein
MPTIPPPMTRKSQITIEDAGHQVFQVSCPSFARLNAIALPTSLIVPVMTAI